ncbi:MAG: ABC transporter permease [Clostridiales bacterium]|jgi:ABC-type antimicrobial peptide transport system permease subunit|nr:ABC transporter permease [Clostridiales bacterium]
MRLIDILTMGVRNLLKRKARTILTILGVLIGTSAIIVMLSLGVGMNEANLQAIEQLGSVDIINVSSYFYQPPDENGRNERSSQGVLDDKAIAQIAAFPEVEAATPLLQTYMNIVSGKFKTSGQVIGINTDVVDKFNYNVREGRQLEASDTNVALFGFQLLHQFYNTRSNNVNNRYYGGQIDADTPPPVDVFNDSLVLTSDWSYGERKQLGNSDSGTTKPKLYKFKGIGILENKDGVYSQNDYSLIVNIEWLKKILAEEQKRQGQNSGGGGGVRYVSSAMVEESYSGGASGGTRYESALVKVRDRHDVEAVQKKINEMGLGASSPLETLKYMEQTTNQIQQLLGAIAAVSLLVAAIGIANTMIMSVYERTREIAVMKVLGCRLGNIGALFLFEAGLIGFFGGVVGVGFSELAAYLLNRFGGDMMNAFGGRGWGLGGEAPPIAIIPLWLVGLGMAFSTVIGLISGFLPARRAMRLSVLRAIHNE